MSEFQLFNCYAGNRESFNYRSTFSPFSLLQMVKTDITEII